MTIYTMSIGTGSTYTNPASITYLDGASGLTKAERTALLRQHCKHAVVTYENGNPKIAYWLNPDNLNLKADGTASDLTGTDGDVMLMYDPVWWKVVSKTNSNITISFSWDGKFANDCVTPHLYGTSTSDAKVMGYVGLGVFEATVIDNQLRSVNADSLPQVSKTNEQFHTLAVTNRNNMYNNMLPLTYMWYVMTLLFEGGSRNSQATYGNGLVSLSSASNVNTDWSATSPWNSETVYTDGKHGVTALGIQNPWGNVWAHLGELKRDSDYVIHFSVLGGGDHSSIQSSTLPSTWATANHIPISTGYVGDVTGDYNIPFLPRINGGSSTTCWTDGCTSNTGKVCCVVGGSRSSGTLGGVFYLSFTNSASSSVATNGSRLQVMIPSETSNTISIYNGSSWTDGTPYVFNGTSWVEADTVYVFNGTSWVEKD